LQIRLAIFLGIDMKKFYLIIAFFAVVSYSKPMESYTNYNVILVHGAASANNGCQQLSEPRFT